MSDSSTKSASTRGSYPCQRSASTTSTRDRRPEVEQGVAKEIERKFTVDPAWRPTDKGVAYEQGYLSSHPERTVRVRIQGTTGKLTIKGATTGVTRSEFE